MPMWMHMTMLICGTLGVTVGGGLYWLLTGQSSLLLFALPLVVFGVEQVFERLIPARCPKCRQRLMCRIFTKRFPENRSNYAASEEGHVVAYLCPGCPYQFPDLQHHRRDW